MKLPLTTRLEWEVKDESHVSLPSRTGQADAIHHQPSLTWWQRWRLIVLASTLLLLACFIGVARLVGWAERNIALTEREVELAVEADYFLNDPTALQPHIQSIELQNDMAIVHVSGDEAALSDGSPIADRTILYHQTAKGWELVETNEQNDAERGPSRYMESTHILFQFEQEDQNLVEAVMPAIEAFTTELFRDSGLNLPSAHKKVGDKNVTDRIAIVVATQAADPADSFELVGYIAWENYGIGVLSPHFSGVPFTLATADNLDNALKATAAYRTILLAVEENQPQAVWRPLVDGLQLWAYSTHREFGSDLANQMHNLLRQRLVNKVPLRLPTLPPLVRYLKEIPATGWQKSVSAKTVIDYMVATYGRSSLARLLNGMHQYDSWQKLIPVVFSVSKEEFERGWQAYLSAKYGPYPCDTAYETLCP